jgi:hypothetical protein
MDHIQQHLFAPPPARVNKHANERGELFDYFLSMLNPDRKKAGYPPLDHPRIGKLLQGVPTKDLYALKSSMADIGRRGGNPCKYFWWSIKPNDQAPV